MATQLRVAPAKVCHLLAMRLPVNLAGGVPQIGYLVGPPPLIAAAAKAHSFLVFTVPSSLQRAVAYGLDHEESFYRRATPDAALSSAVKMAANAYLCDYDCAEASSE